MTGAPLIGITGYQEQASWGVWQQPAALIPQTYVAAVGAAGATAVLLPPQPGGAPGRLLDRLDALVLAGGPDVDPARYGAEPHPRTGEPRELRDGWETGLLTAALERELPVLAICRGMQLLNVALGGTLEQHLPDRLGEGAHQQAPGVYQPREVAVAAGSRLAGILGERAPVLCYHHQAVDRLGAGLVPVAWSEDGTVEALELPGAGFALGVQWHPEADQQDRRLFQALVNTLEEKAK
ncbi:gamma-glutamyl-gamma-aminobutyrate hydrolase family protein [Kitasatospora viridis]|uniref:Putative glutamine amidotransferase n=1 Tax=Kitasatospora viridis TaxID=281105 RepID=A0A561UPL9_9ACTN|nr:gamma-glutamyl-gamma-aminobutyrate hydrolase family protein [Kitasatospora viridis]TWG01284.1 putative glutamine amidotransferase [Kitasatospora viridis]